MKKLNVLRSAPYFYFESDSPELWDLNYEPLGGMQVQIAQQTKAISTLCGKQVVLTIGLPKVPKIFKLNENTEIISVRLPQPKIKSLSKGMVFLLSSWAAGTILWSLLRRLRRQTDFDIIHHHSSDLLSSFIGAPIIAGILGKPLVVTVHCSPNFTFHPSTFMEKLFFPLSRTIEKWVIKKSDFVYVLTDRMKQKYLENAFTRKDKIEVIPDGVDTEMFQEVDEQKVVEFKKKHGLPAGKKLVSYIGRIAPEKGWNIFVDAAKLLQGPDVHFLLCGDGHTRYELEEMIESLGLLSDFTLTGYIPHTSIPEAITASTCIVLPSIHEELGGTTLETMACRRPIVASRVGGIPWVVQDGFNGYLVPPGDSAALASKVRWVLNNPEKAEAVGRNAVEFVRKYYDMNVIANRLVDNYQKLVENGK